MEERKTCDGTGEYTNQFGNTVKCGSCGGSGQQHSSRQPKK